MDLPSSTDVLIAGGGIIGLSIARELKNNGADRITIIEKAKIGQAASFAAAGMLTPHTEVEKPSPFLDFCRDGLRAYPKFAEDLLTETGVDIEVDRKGTILAAITKADESEIKRRYEEQKFFGDAIKKLSYAEAAAMEPFMSPDVHFALHYPNDWQVDNRKTIDALVKFAYDKDIEIIEDTAVKEVVIKSGKAVGLKTGNGEIRAEKVIIANGAWASLIEPLELFKPFEIKPVKGQVIGFRTAKRLISHVIHTPRCYIVPKSDGRILVGATVEDAGFDMTVTQISTEILRDAAVEVIPTLGSLTPYEAWCGLRPGSIGNLPVIRDFSEVDGLYIACGHYRNGILLAPFTAQIIADMVIRGTRSKYQELFENQTRAATVNQ